HTFASAAALSATGTQTVTATDTVSGWIVGSTGVVVSSAPLATPSGMTATAVSASQINLAWVDNSGPPAAGPEEDGFKLYRSTDRVNWVWFATAARDATTFSWYNSVAATTYCFYATAYNAAGESAASNTAAVTTPAVPMAPSGLTAAAVSASQI